MVRQFATWTYKQPLVLMVLSVGLWMLYPPVVNHLVDQIGMFQVAAMAHSFAAVSTLIFAFIVFRRQIAHLGWVLLSRARFRLLALPTLTSGLMICLNHLLLYGALKSSSDFDVVAILVFETWPILFLYIDTAYRNKTGKITVNDYIFSGAAFAGFVLLTAPNMDFADWILLEGEMFKTIGLAFLGGIAMATNCLFRMKCMDGWKQVSDEENLALSNFKKGLLTETFARSLAAPLFLVALFVSEPQLVDVDLFNMFQIACVGIFILAIGSLLYDLSVFQAENASVGILWYLMPIGSVIILALVDSRLLTQYEAVASVLIVSSNIFLALKYPLKSSLLFLFIAICLIGIWLLVVPVATIDNYYDLLAVSTVFFVLLATFALERSTSLNREREDLLVDFRQKLMAICEQSEHKVARLSHFSLLREYSLIHLHTFLRAFDDVRVLGKTQEHTETLKSSILPAYSKSDENREQVLELFRIGDKMLTLESDRITPGEYVILILLGATNVLFSLIFRPETLSASLFAMIVATSMIYLLLIIHDRDKYTQIRRDHALQCRSILQYIDKLAGEPADRADKAPDTKPDISQQIINTLKSKSFDIDTGPAIYWVFAVFSFLVGGFGYGFLYQSFEKNPMPETSPLAILGTQGRSEIDIALLDWPSAEIKAHILANIIEEYIHRSANLISSANDQAFREMSDSDGRIDIHPEIWVQNNPRLIRRYVRAFGTVKLSTNRVAGKQGLCYAGFDNAAAGPLTIKDLKNPAISRQFDMSGDGKGDIWVGDEGWASSEIERERLGAYGLNELYDFREFDYQILSTLVQRNALTKRPSLFFCYYPDTIFTRADVTFIRSDSHDPEIWQQIMNGDQTSLNRTGTSWPDTDIRLAYRQALANDLPELSNLLENFVIPNDELVELLSRLRDGATASALARQWVDANGDLILEWLTGFNLRTPDNQQAG